MCLYSLNLFAASQYISGVQRITFRTGPGTDNKIIKMLASDSEIQLIEEGETWSKIKDSEGVEGYVLNRFISNEVPASVKLDYIKKQYDKLKDKKKTATEQSDELEKKLKEANKELAQIREELEKTQNEFQELKDGSTNYIELKNKYDQATLSLESKTKRVLELESQINLYYIKWFLAGGGVLLLGWIIGLISRKKKNYSSLKL